MRLLSGPLKRRLLRRLLRLRVNAYPPYLGAGVRLESVADDFTHARVRMNLRWYNRNYVGTHFGGSLYAMVDPFPMLLVMQQLGPGYVVWDQAAAIRFVRPGRGRVTVDVPVPRDWVDGLRAAADRGEVLRPELALEVKDESGAVVATILKTLYVRRKAARDTPE